MHGEIKKFVVTSVVMRHFFMLPGAPRACADFCDPTAVSRFNHSGVERIVAGTAKASSKFKFPTLNLEIWTLNGHLSLVC